MQGLGKTMSNLGTAIFIFHLLTSNMADPNKRTNDQVFETAGGLIVIHCMTAVDKENLSNIEWKHGNTTLVRWKDSAPTKWPNDKDSSEQNRIEVKDGSFALHIRLSRLLDSGTYTCIGYGNSSTNGTDEDVELFQDVTKVTVRGKPARPEGKPVVLITGPYSMEVEWPYSYQDNNSPITEYRIYTQVVGQPQVDYAAKGTPKTNVTNITGLQPYTRYKIYVTAVNDVGESLPSLFSEPTTTQEAAPSKNAKPRLIRFENSTTAIYVEFKPPPLHTINGALKGYLVKITDQESTKKVMVDYNPNLTVSQDLVFMKSFSAVSCLISPNDDSCSYNFTDLKPYTMYLISIKVFNEIGEGPVVERAVKTEEGVPSRPRIFHMREQTHASLDVLWEAPRETNGILLGYCLYWELDDKVWNVTLGNQNSYNITNLEPYTQYVLRVAARTSRGYGETSHRPTEAITDVKGPGPPVITNLTKFSATSMKVEWLKPVIVYREIDQYHIKYQPSNSDFGFSQDVTLMSNTIQESQQESHLVSVIRTFKFHKNPGTSHQVALPTTQVVIPKLKPNMVYEVRVAGVTKSLFSDQYFIGTYSEPREIDLQGSDSAPSTNAPITPLTAGVLAGIVITSLIIVIAVIVCFVFRRFMTQSYLFIAIPDSSNTTDNGAIHPESYAVKRPVVEKNDSEHEPIKVEDWAKHVTALHANTDLGFSQEYEEINRNIRADITFEHSAAPENKHKNRYTNIIAYDHSRVILKTIQGKPKQPDYINANYVDGYHKPKAYIATQGPLPATFSDFWQMVWEQNSQVICMITNLTERGRRKCDQYWPNDGEQTYGQLTVKILNTYKMAHYTVRVFTVKNAKSKRFSSIRRKSTSKRTPKAAGDRLLGTGPIQKTAAERVIFQYHYTDWPDHGVPDFTLPVLMYVRKSAAASGENAGPIIIHCSAGVGRTGTYIVLDSMMRQIKDKNTLNAYGFLSHIRNQRNYLVQTEDQYIFIHDALLEYIQSGGDTEVKDSNISKYVEDLLQEDSDKVTFLEKQFKLVTSFEPQDFHLTSAMLPVNLMKNRSKQILPVELARVRLPAQPGEEGSDYINASYLQGYNRNEEYVVTQHPLKSTVTDFWRMVWDRNSMTIVLLSQTDAEEYVEFWPSLRQTMDCGNFKVTFTEVEEHPHHISRDFLLESTQDDYECTTRMISASYWPHRCTPLSTAFELIQTVKSWHQENKEFDGPIIVVDKFGGREAGIFCALTTLHSQMARVPDPDPPASPTSKLHSPASHRFGGTEGGIFCALSTMNDQLHHEGSADVYMVVKLYHLKRPGIIPKQEDYHMLYKALESVCEDSTPAGDRDSGISNCANYPATMPTHFTENSLNKIQRAETTM